MGWYFVGDHRRAEEALLQSDRLAPGDREVRLHLARICLQDAAVHLWRIDEECHHTRIPKSEELVEKAVEYLKDVEPSGPESDDLDILSARAYRLWAGRDYASLHRLCRTTLGRHSGKMGSEEFWFLLSIAERTRRQSLQALRQALERRPHYPEALCLLGGMKGRSNLQGALADFSAALRISPYYEKAFLGRALIRGQLQDWKGMLADLTEAVRLNPADWAAISYRGWARVHTGDREGAMADFSEATRLRPDAASPFYYRGTLREREGELRLALSDFDEAIRRNPRMTDAYNNRGVVHTRLGNIAHALADYDIVHLYCSRHPGSYSGRGQVLARMGLWQRCLIETERALVAGTHFPNETVYKSVAFYDRGLDLYGLGWDNPVPALTEALLRNPAYYEAFAFRGAARFQRGDRLGALHDYLLAWGLAPAEYKRGKPQIKNVIDHMLRSK